MIKVEFVYKTKTVDLPELMGKFQESGENPDFQSEANHIKLEMSRRDEEDVTFMVLDIYYADVETFEKRTEFELNQPCWREIWFGEDNKHEQVSRLIYDVL